MLPHDAPYSMKPPIILGSSDAGTFALPLDLTTQTVAVLAKKGAGKSYTASVMVEELLDTGQVPVIIDPTGAWFGLKSSADGKSAGYPVVVFGGEHADLPLDETTGEATARAIVEQRFPAIIDLSLFRKGQVKRFITPFLETIYRLNRLPLMLVVDEADDICPQKPFGDEAQMVGALEDVVKRGRKKGIGCILITQRPADLAKQVLTQCEMLVAMRLTHPLDIKAVMEWVNVHADVARAAEMVKSLPGLPIGTAYFWSPGWGDIFERVQVRRRRTFDSGATPKAGEKAITPKEFAEIDISKLGAEIAATAQRAKENDPKALKQEIQRLTAELAKKPAVAEIKTVEVPVFTEKEINLMEKLTHHLTGCERVTQNAANRLQEIRDSAVARVAKVPMVAPPSRTPTSIPGFNAPPLPRRQIVPTITAKSDVVLGKCARTLLTVLVQFHPKTCSKNRLALVSGYSLTSSGFSNAVSELRVRGLLEGSSELSPTDAGRAEIGSNYQPLPEGDEAVSHWIGKLGKCPSALLSGIRDNGGRVQKSELAHFTGYSITSSGFSNGLSELRVLGLIQTDSESAWLAPEFNQ